MRPLALLLCLLLPACRVSCAVESRPTDAGRLVETER